MKLKNSFSSPKASEIHSHLKECAFLMKWHRFEVKYKFSTEACTEN